MSCNWMKHHDLHLSSANDGVGSRTGGHPTLLCLLQYLGLNDVPSFRLQHQGLSLIIWHTSVFLSAFWMVYPVISVLPLSFGAVHSRAALKPQTSTSFTLAGGPGSSKENTCYSHAKFKSKGNFSINMGQKQHLDCTHTHTYTP